MFYILFARSEGMANSFVRCLIKQASNHKISIYKPLFHQHLIMREIFLTVMLSHCLSAAVARQTNSKTINEQIIRVENNLFGSTIIDGKFYNLQQRMDHYNVPGLSIAVIDNYQIVWAKGYGYADKSENRRVTTNTLFEPGSISKSLNAIGILSLAQQGKLNLYQDINQYLISWKFPYDTVSKGKKITMAQLLSHTAGVSVYGFPGYERDSILPTIVEILDGKYPANTQPVRSSTQPGKEFNYSGGGILISQQILTDISKEPYEQFMYNNVFKPLGMTHSFFNQPPPVDQRENLATGYESDGTEAPGKYFVYPEKAAAGLWSTPTDLCKYIIEMQLAYKGQASKVLNHDMGMLHLTPYNNQATAMGTFVLDRNGEKYFFHDAANKGFKGLYIAGLNKAKVLLYSLIPIMGIFYWKYSTVLPVSITGTALRNQNT